MKDRTAPLLQRIGSLARESVPESPGRLLVYAEIWQGAGSTDVFTETEDPRVLAHSRGSLELFTLVHSLWEQWQDATGAPCWTTACFLLDGAAFRTDFGYADLTAQPGPAKRREVVLETYFGDVTVSYAAPPASAVRMRSH